MKTLLESCQEPLKGPAFNGMFTQRLPSVVTVTTHMRTQGLSVTPTQSNFANFTICRNIGCFPFSPQGLMLSVRGGQVLPSSFCLRPEFVWGV